MNPYYIINPLQNPSILIPTIITTISSRKRHHVLVCSLHKCILLRDSLHGFGQVWHREGNVQWIYNILLDVRISSSLGTYGGRNVRFDLTKDPTYAYTVWKILSFECRFCNIYWVLVVAMRVNSKAGYMSNIMLVCNQFKEFSRTVGSTDTH